jgi:hypothetical protein
MAKKFTERARRVRACAFRDRRRATVPYHAAVHHRRAFIVASTLAAAIVGGMLVYGASRGAEAAAVTPPAAVSAFVSEPAPDVALAPESASAVVQAPTPPRATNPYESLSQKVDRLSRSADPVDGFAAYQLVTTCIWARDHEGWMAHHILPGDRALLPTTQQACGDIASDQIQSRLRWLERAALAGVHHAATEMLKEGPDGLGLSGSNDIDAPENAPWKQRVQAALDAGVHTCDLDSLESRVDSYESGTGVDQDRAKALTYWVATMECRQRLAGTSASELANGDNVTQRMGDTLTADQIATAVSAGQQLARDARPLPGDH